MFLEEPRSKNASVGELAKFNCSVTGIYLFWTINGSASDGAISKQHNIEEDYSDHNGTTTSILKVPCNIQTNNTLLLCITYEAETVHYSSTAILMVQG